MDLALAKQEFLESLPSLDEVEWVTEYENTPDLEVIAVTLRDEELAELLANSNSN